MPPKGSPKYPKGITMYPGSPKYNLTQAKKITKGSSPSVERERASWNVKLEKDLVEMLHEHNNSYHRGQNGWSRESWNLMTALFQERHEHLKFSKSQLQDKEKDLKRDYRMIKAARMQSGVGWDDNKGMLLAGPHLWENLSVSLTSRIKRYKKKAFPLYDLLAELHDGKTAEGKLSFTSTSEPSMEDEEYGQNKDEEIERGVAEDQSDDELQIMDEAAARRRAQVDHERVGDAPSNPDQMRAQVEHEQAADTPRNPTAAKGNKPKKSPKKSSGDALVGVMHRFVDIKEKDANKEDTNDFSITRCMSGLRTLEGITPDEKLIALEVFRIADNREMFINLVADKDGTAILWIRRHIAKIA